MISSLFEFRQLMKNRYVGKEELVAIQEKKLRALVAHAYDNIPYYHRLFRKAGIKPSDIRTLADLRKIPISTKADLQKVPITDLLMKGLEYDKCKVSSTTGSTGRPFTFYYLENNPVKKFLDYRGLFSNGLSLTDKMLKLDESSAIHRQFFWQNWIQQFGILRKKLVPIEASQIELMRAFSSYKPTAVYGCLSNVKLLAQALEAENADTSKVKHLFTHAELLDKQSRRYLNKTFEVDLIDFFGTSEFGSFAWECKKHKGYHLSSDIVLTEFVDSAESGDVVGYNEEGELVMTGLHQRAMPLIRYSIGDRGIPSDEKCSCGQTLPLMKVISGRSIDYITLSTGQLIAPYHLTGIMEHISGFNQFQIVQQKTGRIDINIVPNTHFNSKTNKLICKRIQKGLGENIEVQVIEREHIPLEKTGKYKLVKSYMRSG